VGNVNQTEKEKSEKTKLSAPIIGLIGAIIGAVLTLLGVFLIVFVKPNVEQKAILTAEAIRTISANQTSTVVYQKILNAELTSVPSEIKGDISIKSIPVSVTDYEGIESGSLGIAWLSFVNNELNESQFDFTYLIPEEEYGYVGLMFRFLEPQDLSDYDYIEIDVEFYDDAIINFYILDLYEEKRLVKIGKNITPVGNNINSTSIEGTQLIKIPLHENFNGIRFDVVSQLEFVVDTYLSNGYSGCLIKDIRFIKSSK
jgi:hypothetical protein